MTFHREQSFGKHPVAQRGRETRRPWTSAHGKAGEARRRWLAKTPCNDISSARQDASSIGSRKHACRSPRTPGHDLPYTARAKRSMLAARRAGTTSSSTTARATSPAGSTPPAATTGRTGAPSGRPATTWAARGRTRAAQSARQPPAP
jgi:hypothetical protein